MTDMQKMLAGMVKPLVFSDDMTPKAETPFYGVAYEIYNGWRGGAVIKGPCKTIVIPESAKAHAPAMAQADYTARILAALNPEAVLAMQDPVAVHANMLRGTIAKPSWANILHLYPVESLALVAAAYADAIAAVREEKDSAAKNLAPDAGCYQDGFSDAIIMIERRSWANRDATAALARMLAEARAEERKEALGAIAAIPTPATEDQARGHEDAYRAVEALASAEQGEG